MVLKIKAIGEVRESVEDVSVQATVADEEAFLLELGKLLYGIETMGFDFSTEEVYNKSVETYNAEKEVLGKKYVVIYDERGIKISVK